VDHPFYRWSFLWPNVDRGGVGDHNPVMPANPWLRHVPAVGREGSVEIARPSVRARGEKTGPPATRVARPAATVQDVWSSQGRAVILFRVPAAPVRVVQRRT
jgi:hypothetical protein